MPTVERGATHHADAVAADSTDVTDSGGTLWGKHFPRKSNKCGNGWQFISEVADALYLADFMLELKSPRIAYNGCKFKTKGQFSN